MVVDDLLQQIVDFGCHHFLGQAFDQQEVQDREKGGLLLDRELLFDGKVERVPKEIKVNVVFFIQHLQLKDLRLDVLLELKEARLLLLQTEHVFASEDRVVEARACVQIVFQFVVFELQLFFKGIHSPLFLFYFFILFYNLFKLFLFLKF